MIADKASFNTSMNRGGMFFMFFAFALFYAQAMAVEHDECSIGESSPKELSYEECVEDLVVEVTAPMVCDEEPVGGLARGKKVLHKNSHEDFPSSVSVSISGVCDKGHVHTAAVMVDLVKKRSGDSEPGASGLGESPGASSGNEDAPRVRSAFRSNTLSLPVPSRYIPRGAPVWYVSLGGSATGVFGGRFELSPQRMFAPTPKYDSSLLKLVGSASVGLDVVYQESKGGADENRFRAVRSKTCFAKFSSPTSFPFSVSFYLGGDLEEDFDEHGDYVLLPSAKPFVVYNFSAVDTNDASRTILVEEKREGLPVKRTLLFRKEANGQFSYGVVQGDGVFTNEIAQVSLVGNKRTIERRYTGKCGYSGVVLEEYDYIAGADVLIKRTETSGDEFRQSIYEYYPHADVSQLPRLRKETSYNGEVTEYVYDDSGRIIRETHTFPCGEVRVRENSYIPLGVRPHCPDGNGNDILTDDGTVEIATPRIETEKVNGIVISKTLRFVSIDTMDHRIIEEVRLLNPASDDIQGEWENPANERTYGDYKPKDSCRACSERPVLLKKADGTIERYSYGSGDYVPGAGGSAGVFTLRSGGEAFQSIVTRYPAQNASLSTDAWGALIQIPYVTTREVTVEVRASKKVLLKEQYVCTGSGRDDFERISWRATSRDDLGQETLVVSSDGSRTGKTYIGNRLNTMIAADGSVVTYIYDSLSRVISETQSFSGIRPNITTLSSYDLEGRLLERTVASAGLSETETSEYDGFGRMTMSASPDGIITKYLYDTDAIAGLETKTVIRGFGTPCAITNETVSYVDGRIKETRLNGKLKSTYTYGTEENGYKWTKTHEGEMGVNSARWTLAKTNPLGQTIEEIRPGFGGATLVTSNIYNSAGQLLASRLSDSQGKILNSSIFCYDSSGQRYLSVEDLNCNSIIDFTEVDRVVSNDTRYVKIDGDWWRESSSWQTRENNSAALTRISCVRERLTGIGVNNLASEIKSFDIHGKLTTTRTYRDRNALTFTQITDTPDSIFDAKAISIAGLLSTNITASGIITDYTYDALGRQLSEADGRGNVTEACYDEKGRVVQTLDGAGNVTTYTYDALGRQTSVTDPNGMTVTTVYDAEGHVISQRGATYPVDYAYDEFGNKVAMMCYREEGTGNGDITRWFYDEATGLVTNKVDADGKGPSYTYTPDGKLATRTWARGVVTAYAYDSSGALTNTVYSDDTPTISMVYDRVGNMLSAVTDGVCTNLYAYSLTGLCTNEVQDGATIARSYDTLGRSTGYTLQASQNSVDISTIKQSNIQTLLSYDALGRIASLSIITNDSSNIPTFQHSNIQTFTYSYLLETDIVDGYTCGNFSRKIEFEPLRNLVAAVTNSYANRVISAFDYTNDAAGRRIAISRSGEAFGDLSGATDSYGYNSRNEVISARRTKNGEIIHGFNEDFEYDPIGNRISSTTYSELGEPKTSQYIANNLNQYTSRTVPGYAAVRGHADADATVTVNEKPTYRYGEYFFGSDEFDNSQFAVEAELITSAVLASPTNGPDEVCSVTFRVHIPKATQHFSYDLDGNLSTDGYYTFTYDSNNRLKTVSTNGVLVLTNFYDEKSRRVKKVTADAVITFFYDDWNLVEERIVYTNGAMTTIHYCWGTDLSGTLHGAGGVGGLLYLTVDDEIYIPCYDNNGNITQYLDVNGYSVASYAYDSFGGIIIKSGPLADFFRHRFSTKYFDTETCLYYYGYRFYSPSFARWMNRDPKEEDGGVNLYAFCKNCSLSSYDPEGCLPLETIWDLGNVIYDIYVGDEVALAADIAALFVPYVPAGTTKLVKAARLSKVEKICPGAKKLEVTYKYVHVDYHFTKGPRAAKEWVLMTKGKQKSYWKPQTTDTDVKGYIDAALRKAKAEGKIKPSQLKGYEYDVGSPIGATNGRQTSKIKIQVDSNGYIHAHPWP